MSFSARSRFTPARCGRGDGHVYLIRDGVKSSAPLHEECAAAFFGREGSVRMRSPDTVPKDDPDGWSFNHEDGE